MNATLRLLDAWKASQGITSDNAAAIELGVGRAAISRWRSDDRNAEPATVARMAEELGQDPTAWILAVEAEKSKAENKRILLQLARKLGYAAIMFLAVYTSIPMAHAKATGFNVTPDVLYIRHL